MSNFYIEATVMLSEDTATGKHINDYLIIDTLSSSPTSSVYRAEDTRLKNSTVTLKLLHTMHLSEQRHQQFLRKYTYSKSSNMTIFYPSWMLASTRTYHTW